jgi:hypothetical protein
VGSFAERVPLDSRRFSPVSAKRSSRRYHRFMPQSPMRSAPNSIRIRFLCRSSARREPKCGSLGTSHTGKLIKEIKRPRTRRIRGFSCSCIGRPICCAYQAHQQAIDIGLLPRRSIKLSDPTLAVARVGPTHPTQLGLSGQECQKPARQALSTWRLDTRDSTDGLCGHARLQPPTRTTHGKPLGHCDTVSRHHPDRRNWLYVSPRGARCDFSLSLQPVSDRPRLPRCPGVLLQRAGAFSFSPQSAPALGPERFLPCRLSVSGFVVEIFSSLSEPAPGWWLAERDGRWCVVSDVRLARHFATEDEARAAADEYRRENESINYRIVWQ